jgi:hypothetical protein
METLGSERAVTFLSPLSVRRYIYLSTLLGIFSGILRIDVGSTIFFFYLIMLSNLLLMWAFIGPLVVPKWLAWFMLFLAVSSAIGIIRGTDTLPLAGKQFVAIGLCAFYFANFFNLQGNTIDRAWSTYCKLVYWSSLLALAIWPAQCLIARDIVRLQGIASEPAGFCLLALPACYWYAYSWATAGTNRKEVFWIMLAICASASSLGFIGVALGLLLLLTRKPTKMAFIAPLLVVGLIAGIYAVSSNFRFRANDTAASLMDTNVAGTNISTYALVSNMVVTERVLESHPLLGNGLGSHSLSNERYIGDVPGVDEMVDIGWDAGANTHDAASLTLRSLSEMGLLGFLSIIWYIWHFRVSGAGSRAAISSAIFVVFFQKLLRGGGYSNPEQFFFVVVYMLNFKQFRAEKMSVPVARTPRGPFAVHPKPNALNA